MKGLISNKQEFSHKNKETTFGYLYYNILNVKMAIRLDNKNTKSPGALIEEAGLQPFQSLQKQYMYFESVSSRGLCGSFLREGRQ